MSSGIGRGRYDPTAATPQASSTASRPSSSCCPTFHSVGCRCSMSVLPCLSTDDEPRFAWRGMHLDVCRHFFPVEFVKKYIDLLARYKMNTLPLAPHRRPGLADRDQEVPEAHRGRRVAQRTARIGPYSRRDFDEHALRRLLHAGADPRGGGLRAGAAHHRRARDRDARPRDGRAGGLSGARAAPAARSRCRKAGACSRTSSARAKSTFTFPGGRADGGDRRSSPASTSTSAATKCPKDALEGDAPHARRG